MKTPSLLSYEEILCSLEEFDDGQREKAMIAPLQIVDSTLSHNSPATIPDKHLCFST